jgi:hypothetical protein
MNPDRNSSAPQDVISRRRALKRIGAGAAIAWSAPVLTSIRIPAFAQYGGSPCEPGQVCTPDCDDLRPCQSGSCGCFRNVDTDECHCLDLFFGLCENIPDCATGADCSEGLICYASCCPGTGKCGHDCTGAAAPKKKGTGQGVTK